MLAQLQQLVRSVSVVRLFFILVVLPLMQRLDFYEPDRPTAMKEIDSEMQVNFDDLDLSLD